jgi:hypothetical protein
MHQLYVLGARQKKLRLKKEDAWNLYEEALIVEVDTQTGAAKQCIDIAVQTPRDGRVGGGRIYFTTVDGRLVIANVDTHQVDQVIDLRKIAGTTICWSGVAACSRWMSAGLGWRLRACAKPNSPKTCFG